jgi:hypothetical protein
MDGSTKQRVWRWLPWLAVCAVVLYCVSPSLTRQKDKDQAPNEKPPAPASSYDQVSPVLLGQETYAKMLADDKAAKPAVMARQQKLLEERYNLMAKTDSKVKMTRGKPIPVGPTAKLANGMTWEKLGDLTPAQVLNQRVFPKGYLPLPHPKHEVGGMVFPQVEVKLLPRLERFDIDFDLPEAFLPEFPPAIFLTTRPDLGDVSQGKVVTIDNFNEIFNGILNAKDLEGVRSFRSSSSTPVTTARRKSPTACAAWPALTATSTATRRPRRTWSATSARRATAAASTRRVCAASTSSGCSARSAP